ncbi:MAG: BamA/TamA family outer membrane protein [Bacteroidota bacterium]
MIRSLPHPAVPGVLALVCALTLAACTSSRSFVDRAFDEWQAEVPPERSDLAHRVFLIGDIAASEDRAGLGVLEAQLAEAGENSTVVFLGDQLKRPLPDSLASNRAEAEAPLLSVVEAVEGYEGRVVVVPGDGEWRDGTPEDAADFLRDRLGENVVVPEEGLPGPTHVKLDDGIRLLALDTEWWLQDADDRPTGEVDDEDIESELDVLIALTELLAKYDDDRIIVVGHHPVFSNGERGGHYSLRQHLFPLTDVWEPLYIPLPVVGSVYPLLRGYFGGRQDFSGSDYRTFREALPAAIEEHDGVIYAAAHEYGLQYTPFRTDALELQHHITSGGGSTRGSFAGGFGAGFAHASQGFASVQFYQDGTMWLEFWEPEAGNPQGRLAFRTQLEEALREDIDPQMPDLDPAEMPDYTDSTRVVVADPDLGAGAFQEFFLGDNYRDVWTAPVSVRVLDLGRDKGGLTPVKRGGGYQTVSLRVKNPEGREFVLRQVQKRPDLLLPSALQVGAAADILSDQTSSANPYAALVVPRLAEAAGIYHTNPEFVVVPDDPRLGVYREDFAGTLALFEERPADDVSDQPHFGGAKDVDSSVKLLRELREDNDTRVDARFFLRSRLFDALIGDWDRHEDQWRWAQFEPFELDPTLTGDDRKQGKVYRPIPRDRDQVFFRLTGLFPRIAQYYVPGLQDFDPGYGNVGGLTENGRELDRRLLNELSREDWEAVARDLQARMTDEAFAEALQDWPTEVNALHGERIYRSLQTRRAALAEFAGDWYGQLTRFVDVVGSDKHERFVVERRGEETEVTVYKTSKKGENRKVIYRRVFHDDETREVRLYGLGGRDRFEISGEGDLYIRVIGGPGEDVFADRARVGNQVHYYDTPDGNEIERGDARLTLSDDPGVNRYDPKEFGYSSLEVFPRFGFNPTDGPVVGFDAAVTTSEFRRRPFGHRHQLAVSVATFRGAVSADYQSRWTERVGPFDAVLDADGATPRNVLNFYGLGNETVEDRDFDFYRVRLARASAAAGLELNLVRGLRLGLLPAADLTIVDRDPDLLELNGVTEDVFEEEAFAGGDARLIFEHADRMVNPRQGFRWENRAGVRSGILNTSDTFGTLESMLTAYLSPSLQPQVTLALRVGAEHIVGDFPFYRAATLGGTTNLRGYRSTRFSGRSAFYQNAELRVGLARFTTYAAAGSFGLVGFVDNGRVWADGERSSVWHQGYGGGLWMNLFDMILVNGTVGVSEEATIFNVGVGFLY